MNTKSFDCVEMKRRGARVVQDATGDMTLPQKLAYWREREAAMRREQADLIAAQPGRSHKLAHIADEPDTARPEQDK